MALELLIALQHFSPIEAGAIAAALGQNLSMLGELLGHPQVQAAARYAHPASDPAIQAIGRGVQPHPVVLLDGRNQEQD